MKITFLTRRFFPLIGGVEKHVLEVSKRLVELGHDVTVVTEELEDKNTSNYHSKSESATLTGNLSKLRIHRIHVGKDDWFKKFRIWRSIWKIRHELLSSDIVHCHDVFFWYLPFRLLYFRKKVFTTFHGYEIRYPPRKRSIFVRKISEKSSRGNICIGEYIEKWYGTKADYISYGGVDRSLLQVPVKRMFNTGMIPNILYIGRISDDNGVKTYERMLSKLKKRKNPFSFSAVGDGPYKMLLLKYGKVYGFVTDVENYIMKADIILASSVTSILESLALRKPVFATFTNPLKEDYLKMTEYSKWITIVSNYDQMYTKIEQYVKNPGSYKENTNLAFKWAKSQTWEEVAKTYVKLWSK